MVRFPDVMFAVRFPLYAAVRLAEERSTHLSVDRKTNHHSHFAVPVTCFFVPCVQKGRFILESHQVKINKKLVATQQGIQKNLVHFH